MLEPRKVGIAGLGTIGLSVAHFLDGGIPGLSLAAVSVGSIEKAQKRLKQLKHNVSVLDNPELIETCDIIVECLPPELFETIAYPAAKKGKTLIVFSSTQLLKNWELVEISKNNGGKIIVATGAMVGLDGIRAASLGTNVEISLKTYKPSKSLAKAPYVVENDIELPESGKARLLFSGSVNEAANLFPANVNVAVSVCLAGIGSEKTRYELWADPDIELNTHVITVDCDQCHFEIKTTSVPDSCNPATGLSTYFSGVDALKRLSSSLLIGG